MARLLIRSCHKVKADGTGFRALGADAVADGLFGIFGHQTFEFCFGLLMLEMLLPQSSPEPEKRAVNSQAAPCGAARPARYTPRAHTTAGASVIDVSNTKNATRADDSLPNCRYGDGKGGATKDFDLGQRSRARRGLPARLIGHSVHDS
jgi:hypothetical protein